MKIFKEQLVSANPPPNDRRWIFVPYDQLSYRIGPLSREAPEELGIILVENPWKAARRPYHRQKLALVLANLRHFALEQARRGVAVRHVVAHSPYREALRPLVRDLGPLRVMEPAERELRADLEPLIDDGGLEIVPHEGWLTSREQFVDGAGREPPWRMDGFYRRVRRDTGLLMEDGKPIGGKYSFDADNRQTWRGEPPAPEPPRFRPDEITREVGELIEARFARHPGELDLNALPASRGQVDRLWRWARESCLEHFGPYEDAMSTASSGLFHTRVSPLVNLHRLLPRQVVDDVAALDAPLASREGFVRQVIGWREFMRHVHLATDGFRELPEKPSETAETPGDGGWQRWADRRWEREPSGHGTSPDGGARPSHLAADFDLPPAFWGEPSGLDCLDRVVADVWREGWSHHITRLMVLANLATLLDVDPRQLTDWFWVAFIDAYDWVVEPNVLGMGTFAVGELMTTKPYVSGSAYIDRMSDFCRACRFDPKRDCPIKFLYWAFLDRHRGRFEDNPRLALPLKNLARRKSERRAEDRRIFRLVRERLAAGEELDPEDLAPTPSRTA